MNIWFQGQQSPNPRAFIMGRKQSGGGGCSCRIRSTMVREFLAEFLGNISIQYQNLIHTLILDAFSTSEYHWSLIINILHVLKGALNKMFVMMAGTFVLVCFGTASIAQSVLSLRTKGDFFTINWGWVSCLDSGILSQSFTVWSQMGPRRSPGYPCLRRRVWWPS